MQNEVRLMLQRLKKLLQQQGYEHWKILIREEHSHELFFVGHQLDLSRDIDTQDVIVTLYRDNEDHSLRGNATGQLDPHFTDHEILDKLDFLYQSCLSTMNPWYPLMDPHKHHQLQEKSAFQRHGLAQWAQNLAEGVLQQDTEDCNINSMELYLSEIRQSLSNSKGLEAQYNGNRGLVDLVTQAKNAQGEESELHGEFSFSDFEPEELANWVKNQLAYTKDRALAVPLASMVQPQIILREEAIAGFFNYWIFACSSEAVYKKIHQSNIGESLIKNTTEGDGVSLIGLNRLYNAPDNIPFDSDGLWIKQQELIMDGEVKAFHGDVKHSYYLKQPATGKYSCFSVLPGSLSEEQLYQNPYLEIISFSDFKMDSVTGDFGGEIRLAYGYDGHTTITYTGGAVTGNLKSCISSLKMLNRAKRQGNLLVPEALSLQGLQITPAG
ncbi:MAG: metallopeptidase TldD-related protein [Spirochaetaceae bacterium]|jgi:predicted Zn-dependent protease|nr:metallopeptidase TldD-related protein [Spirochaetaceae bacterium]